MELSHHFGLVLWSIFPLSHTQIHKSIFIHLYVGVRVLLLCGMMLLCLMGRVTHIPPTKLTLSLYLNSYLPFLSSHNNNFHFSHFLLHSCRLPIPFLYNVFYQHKNKIMSLQRHSHTHTLYIYSNVCGVCIQYFSRKKISTLRLSHFSSNFSF